MPKNVVTSVNRQGEVPTSEKSSSMAQQETFVLTQEYWDSLPFQFRVDEMAKLTGTQKRYVQNHADDLGGVKLGGRWVFFKPTVAKMLGLEI